MERQFVVLESDMLLWMERQSIVSESDMCVRQCVYGRADLSINGHPVTIHFVVNDVLMCFFFGIAVKELVEALKPGGALYPPKKARNAIHCRTPTIQTPTATPTDPVYFVPFVESVENSFCEIWPVNEI